MLTIEQARALYTDDDPVHDFNHVLRVLALAERLAEAEDADLTVVRQAALLHDISRAEDHNAGTSYAMQVKAETDHAILAARYARDLLVEEDPAFIEAVAHCIEAHRYRNAIKPESIEAQCLFDADKLDAIGAVGVARSFAYAGGAGNPLWGDVSEGYTPGQSGEAHTPRHEFEIKLKHIRDRMYTTSGKRMAEERHAYMVAFFKRMAREVSGEA